VAYFDPLISIPGENCEAHLHQTKDNDHGIRPNKAFKRSL